MMCNLAYMDNVAYSSSNKDDVIQAYVNYKEMFTGYEIKLQQNATNCAKLNTYFDDETKEANLFG